MSYLTDCPDKLLAEIEREFARRKPKPVRPAPGGRDEEG